ncbi:hypothetical protein MTBBW1_1440001 [Desulfamplus magnetovallimortis]|uniref:Uncharacterized protein n=1 Tax=Desulfamplus magnetovallimortis TaxID=1246637 RepID=A0A1W1H888_9BACT|nr:hypothetical protein [Desulfamplus magnetovallimortis]SLM28681.1 hypothetical protein MTBBW1_1440001 [Desulfamplus magnetovallimortis]
MEDMTDSCKEINSKELGGRGVRLRQITIFLILFQVVLISAAEYLDYCDPPQKADVVVLFLGPERIERSREAAQLIKDGYADNLFVPGHRRTGNGFSPFIREPERIWRHSGSSRQTISI